MPQKLMIAMTGFTLVYVEGGRVWFGVVSSHPIVHMYFNFMKKVTGSGEERRYVRRCDLCSFVQFLGNLLPCKMLLV